MTKPAALAATFSDLKLVKSRQVAQLIFEVPLANFDAAYEILGGLPDPAAEKWFAIAKLDLTREGSPQPTAARTAGAAPRNWNDLTPTQQAGIRCEEPSFSAFLKEERPDDWHESEDPAECVRLICGVTSRSELVTNQKARMLWHQLDGQYGAWKALEHA